MKTKIINLFYEKGVEKEADISKDIIEVVFDFKVFLMEKEMKELFKYSNKLNGFIIQIPKDKKACVVLTKKDIFPYGSSSKEDDWVFGFFTNQGKIIISTARIGRDKKKRTKRLIYLLIHEFSHFVFKDKPKHYKDFIYKNPKAGHILDLGKHCTDNKCVMSEFIDLKDLDNHIKDKYENYFCEKCMKYL